MMGGRIESDGEIRWDTKVSNHVVGRTKIQDVNVEGGVMGHSIHPPSPTQHNKTTIQTPITITQLTLLPLPFRLPPSLGMQRNLLLPIRTPLTLAASTMFRRRG